VDEGMKSPEARMLTSFLRRRGDLGFCILEYPLDIFLDTGLCRRHRSLLTMSQLLSRIDAVCFEGVEELSRGFGGRIVRSNTAGDVVCDALERSKVVNVIEAKRELNRQVLGDILLDIWVVSTYSPELLGRTRFCRCSGGCRTQKIPGNSFQTGGRGARSRRRATTLPKRYMW